MIAVYDFFCGCGGTSNGFRNAGLDIAFALDFEKSAAETYKNNFQDTIFYNGDIRSFDLNIIRNNMELYPDHYKLFCACAPCQPFTKQRTNKKISDDRVDLLEEFIPIIGRFLPEFVFIENVPGLQKGRDGVNPLQDLRDSLRRLGYELDCNVVFAQDYGTPQVRKRFILMASLHCHVTLPNPTHGPGRQHEYRTVYDAIVDLPPILAGEQFENDQIHNHRAAKLSPKNLERIRAIPHNGGSRESLPENLRLRCHTKMNNQGELIHKGHTDVYGRLNWNRPAPGLTTRCNSISNGRFGHPDQDRALSIREAARIQGFDDTFIFYGNLNSMAKQIGNAVPSDLAFAVGQKFLELEQELEARHG